MNGVALTTVGRLLGHRQRDTTAIYAHLDDGALRDAAAQAAALIARATGYRAEPPPSPKETDMVGDGRELDRSNAADRRTMRGDPLDTPTTANRSRPLDWMNWDDGTGESPQSRNIHWLGDDPFKANSDSVAEDGAAELPRRRNPDWL